VPPKIIKVPFIPPPEPSSLPPHHPPPINYEFFSKKNVGNKLSSPVATTRRLFLDPFLRDASAVSSAHD